MGTIYYYIDETGTLDPSKSEKDRFFVLSCNVTDTPEDIRSSLTDLKNEIENNPYFASQLEKFQKKGFHASANHFDIRAKYYSKLHSLNFRTYSVIVDKWCSKFNDLVSRDRAYYEILFVLLYKRILSNRQFYNIIILEEYGKKPQNHLKKAKLIVEDIIQQIKEKYDINPVVDVVVHDKSDINLSMVDYMNYVLFHMLSPKPYNRMKENFSLIEPKIGLVHSFFEKKFFSERNRINFDDIKSGQK